MRIRNCLDCGAKQKWVFQDNQNNHNTKNYKSKTHSVKGIIRVEVCWALQYLYTQMKGAESDYWTINLSVQNKYWGTNKRKYFRDILSFCSLKYKKHKVFWKFWHGIPLILAVSAYMAETFAFHEKILQQWGNRLVNIVLQNLFIIFAVYFLYQSSANTQTYIDTENPTPLRNRVLRVMSPISKMPSSPKVVHLTSKNIRTPSKISSTKYNKNFVVVYLGQATQEVKVPDLLLPIKPMKEKNQPDAEFDMYVFDWKEKPKIIPEKKQRKGTRSSNRCSHTNVRRTLRRN